MKKAVFRLVGISILVILFLIILLSLLSKIKDPSEIRLHSVLKNLKSIELLEKIQSKNQVKNQIKKSKNTIGFHLYPAKNFWLIASRLKDKSYFTKKDLNTELYLNWINLLKQYPKKTFFLYIHSQNPVDLFKFIKHSRSFKNRLLIYSDFLKTAAWFRKEAPLMAIALSPSVLLRINFFSRFFLEGLIPIRAHFAYIKNKDIGLKTFLEIRRRGLPIIVDKNLENNKKINLNSSKKWIKNTLLKNQYFLLIKNNGI